MITSLAMSLIVASIGVWQFRHLRRLGREPESATPCTVSLIIPARNEADSLPHLLGSIARQHRAADEVIVVDDGSTDGTAAMAAAAGATVVTAPERPEGWLGKPWACQVGADAAAGDVLVFLDADVTLGPDSLDRLLATHEREGGLLSVQPHHDAPRWWEQASAFPNLVSVLATGALRPRSTATAVAFGPCLVTDRASYERAGTHAAVADQVIEDIHLARAYQSQGLPVTCCIGADDVRFRMYPAGPRQLIEGWTKNLAGGPGLALGAPLALGVAWLLAVSSVVGTTVMGVVHLDPAAVVPWLITALTIGWMLRQIGSFRWWTAPAFPVWWLAFVLLFAWSAIARAGGLTTWRGRRLALRGP